MTNSNVVSRNVDIPGLHDGVPRSQVLTLRAKEVFSVPVPETNVGFLQPIVPEILAHESVVSIDGYANYRGVSSQPG